MFVDLSHTLDETVQVYPGDPVFSCCPSLTIANDGFNVLKISMGSHSGTHVDAPFHFVEKGSTIDTIPLSAFVGNAVVVPVTDKSPKEKIEWADIAPHEDVIRRKASLPDGVFVLLHTGWSKFWKSDQYYHHPFLSREAAEKLLTLGVKLIGVDTLSPDETRLDGSAPDFGVHAVFLGGEKIIAENLTNLEQIQDGDWLVNMVPLKLSGSDGSPVRAFATRVATEARG